ncbi:MAG TPA: peptidylprolyl isomerase [Planctomycetota bacterium]|nr:peptidylprolyl isomerase [Planctomycetota bacterium]
MRLPAALPALLLAACASSTPPPPAYLPSAGSSPGALADTRPTLDLAGSPLPPAADAEPRGALPAGDDPVVAEVDGLTLRASEVARYLFRYDPGRALEVLNQMLDERILEADAAAAGVSLPAGEVEALVAVEVRRREDEMRVQFGPGVTFEEYLRERFGFTLESYRKDVSALFRIRALRDRLVRFDAMKEERVRVRLLVTRTEQEARDAAGRLRAGADFAAVARLVSLAPSEDLPPFSREEIHPPALSEEIFALSPGEVSRPVRVAADGKEVFQVFKLIERRAARSGAWAEVADEVERGLKERPVLPAEYLQWARRARERHGVRVLLEEPASGGGGR